eukprot:TRINITY_DN61867_c0_g1_i1.p1 TRINITY_DN61867_c0_g1~~TRINITY_DN61867_c0_g1_i1.p1  ORF type:complete len:243 (+),score=90.17 TRINITY_DN61867_c0_g1_i1:92-730(+)
MPSFTCGNCGDVVKKPKVPDHARWCWTEQWSCIDCNKYFDNEQIKTHTSCVTEVERYAGKWLEKKKNERQKQGGGAKQPPAAGAAEGQKKRPGGGEEPEAKKARKAPSASPAAQSAKSPAAKPAKSPAAQPAASPAAAPKDAAAPLQLSVKAGALRLPLAFAKRKALRKAAKKAAAGTSQPLEDLVRAAAAEAVEGKLSELCAAVRKAAESA